MSIYDYFDGIPFQSWSWEREDQSDIETFIYVLQEGDDGPIKIGVSKDPERRLQMLQTGNVKRLHLLLKRLGTRQDENHLHQLLSVHRLEGEWFEYCLPVQAVIEELKYPSI